MYKSPIQTVLTDLKMQMDGQIMKAVRGVCVNVDKGELLRALKYDRDQYEQGYQDGYLAGYAAATCSNQSEDRYE